MKKYFIILALLLCLPSHGFAQDSAGQNDTSSASGESSEGTTASPEGTTASPEGTTASPEGTTASPEGTTASPEGKAAVQPGTSNIVLPVVVPNRRQYTPRPMRQIENREFSNRDKIMLLLSAHCDFPTKEDLISTVSFDKMLEDEEEMAANASMTGRRPKTDGSTPETAGSNPQSAGETPKPDSPSQSAGETAKPDSPAVAAVETKPNTADSGNAKPAAPAVRTAKPEASVARKDFDWRKMTPEERERVELYLQNILYTILKDESVLLTVRGRALEALAYFNTEKNIKMLTFILTHSERIKRPMMLVQAIRAFPEVAPDKAAEILAPFLEHENDMVRFVTIRTLQKTPGNEAVQVMQKRLDVETNRFFKARLQESIQCHDQKQTNCR